MIPANCAAYRDDIRRHVQSMIYKLSQNAHKGRWQELNLVAVIKCLKRETEELEEAIAEDNYIKIILESADVSNFALIAASIATERGK
jgi:hypothetical protein